MTSNLLQNPGAETGTGVDHGSTVADWTVGGTSNPGRDDSSFDGYTPHSGSYDFYGGTGASGSLIQIVSLAGFDPNLLSQIDSGYGTANIEFFEQSLNQGNPSDQGEVVLSFMNGSGGSIAGGYDSGLIYNIGSWEDVTGTAAIPAGTRAIQYQMVFTREVGSDLDSFIDDNSLTISSVPEPGSAALVAAGLICGVRRRGKRLRPRLSPFSQDYPPDPPIESA